MMMRPADLDKMLTLTVDAVEHVDLAPGDTHDLLHTVDRLLDAGVKLQRHLAFDPGATIDRHGRCSQCGRLLTHPPRPRAWSDGTRGCAFLPAAVVAHARWVANYAMSTPLVGKALWMLQRGSGR